MGRILPQAVDGLIRLERLLKIRGMRILAVDTTSSQGSIALLEGDDVRGLASFTADRDHAQRLLPELDALLTSLGMSLSEIEGYAVTVGPGSFTGIRIGIATVEGLSFATGRPMVGVSALEATAYRYRCHHGLIAPLLDARRGEIFGALFRSDGGSLELILEPVCQRPEAFLARMPLQPVLFAGSGLAICQSLVWETLGERAQFAEPFTALAEEVARIGKRRLEKGQATPLGGLGALYLRPSDARKVRR